MRGYSACHERKNEKGFTLVEIMAVIFIIAITISLVAINVGSMPERKLSTEAQRIYQKIRLLMDYAETHGVEMGMKIVEQGCEFYQFDEPTLKWNLIQDNEFSPVRLDDLYLLDVDLLEAEIDAGVLYGLSDKQKAVDYGEKQIAPDIVFFSDGQLTPFNLTIRNKQSLKPSYSITGESPYQLRITKNEK